MDTGTIIVLAVIAAIILVALLVALPRMRRASAERKAEQDRRDRERQLERARQERAQEHRSTADVRTKEAELAEQEAQIAEQEARRARADAEINARRAKLHEQGLADNELGIDGAGDEGFRRVEGGRAHEPLADTDADGSGRRRDEVEGDTRPDGEFERGYEEGRETGAMRDESRVVRSDDRTEPEQRSTS